MTKLAACHVDWFCQKAAALFSPSGSLPAVWWADIVKRQFIVLLDPKAKPCSPCPDYLALARVPLSLCLRTWCWQRYSLSPCPMTLERQNRHPPVTLSRLSCFDTGIPCHIISLIGCWHKCSLSPCLMTCCWQKYPLSQCPIKMRLIGILSVTLFHDLRSENKGSDLTMFGNQVWQIIDQIHLGTIPANDRTNTFTNSCYEFVET